MSLKSSSSHYGSIAIIIHWMSALLIIILLATGFRTASTFDPSAKAQLLAFHAPLGIIILLLTLARIIWWWLVDHKPASIAGMPRWQNTSSRIVHIAFYIIILGMAASGIGMFILSGAGPVIFSGEAAKLPDFQNYPPRIPHGIGARAMVVLLLFHTFAAFYHHFVKRDGLLRRMWFQRHEAD